MVYKVQRKKKTPYRQQLHSLIMAAGIEHFGSYTYKFFLTPFGSGHLLRVCCSCVLTYPSTTPDFFLRRNLRTGCHNCETTALLCAPVASIGDTLCKMLLNTRVTKLLMSLAPPQPPRFFCCCFFLRLCFIFHAEIALSIVRQRNGGRPSVFAAGDQLSGTPEAV